MAEVALISGCLSLLLWPFVMLWTLLTTIVRMMGRLMLLISGFLIMITGAVLTITIFGAVVGVPLVILGFLLVVRALF